MTSEAFSQAAAARQDISAAFAAQRDIFAASAARPDQSAASTVGGTSVLLRPRGRTSVLLIRLQRIYNFDCSMLLYYLFWMFNGLYYALLYYFWD